MPPPGTTVPIYKSRHAGLIAAVVFLVIFIILFAVFTGLFVRTRGLYTSCQATLSGFTCPMCPTCALCPTNGGTGIVPPVPPGTCLDIMNGYVHSTAAGTSRNESLIMTCPVNGVIAEYQVYTKIVDTGSRDCGKPVNITEYVNALGEQDYAVPTSQILRSAGIDPYVDIRKHDKVLPTRIVYGSYACTVPGSVEPSPRDTADSSESTCAWNGRNRFYLA